MTKYHDNPTSYEELIDNARLSFRRNEELEDIIKKVCYDYGIDSEGEWAILECFANKE